MYNKIINPKTGRTVNINGKLGRQIIVGYIEYMNAGASPGDEHSKSRKSRVRFDPTASKYDSKCNKLSYSECDDSNNEESFNCKWIYTKNRCIAIESDDLEELFYDRIDEDFYEMLSEEEKN